MVRPPSAADIIARLELKPHPEGGHYRETFVTLASTPTDVRCPPRSISCWRGASARNWHRIDAVEIWHYTQATR